MIDYKNFYSELSNNKEQKRVILEAKFNSRELAKSKYQSQWLDYIENEKPFELEPKGTVVIDKSMLNSTGFGQKTLKSILDGNGTMEDFNNFFKDGNTYEPVLKGKDGKLYSLTNISKSTFTGQGGGQNKKPRDAAYYEMGLCVEYNKAKGMDDSEAFKKADVDPDKYEKYKEHLTEVCRPVAEKLPDLGPYLKQTGGDSYTPSPQWPSSDGTPKTDIFGGKAHRVSVKKKGGSQLVSGKAGDTKGIFMGGLGFYEKYSKQEKEDLKYVIDSIEHDFVNLNTDRSVTQVKNSVEKAYIKWRIPQVENSIRKLNIKASSKEIKRHVRAELKIIGLTDQQGNYENWIIDGIEPLSERKIMKWFDDYWRSLGTEQLQSEVRDIVNAKINNKKLDKEFKKIFKGNKAFKTWCVYEAASGNFKFSGTADLNSTLDPIANQILIFGENGDVTVDGVDEKWADSYSGHVNVQVSFKSSGRSKYTALRLLSENVDYNDLSSFEKETNIVIENEIQKLHCDVDELFENYFNERKNILNEFSLKGMMRKLKDIGKRLMNNIFNKIKMFYNNVIKRILSNLKKAATQGIKKFAEYLGLEIDGEALINVQF